MTTEAKKSKKAVPKKPDMKKLKQEQAKKAKKDKKESAKVKIIKPEKNPLPVLSENEKKEHAVANDQKFRDLEVKSRHTFIEMAVILREMKVYGLHAYLKNENGKTFSSFDAWLKEAAPLSRAGGYAALKAGEKLLPIIPKAELDAMPRHAITLLSKLPKLHLENVTIRKAAATQSKKKLIETINKEAPEAHIEQSKNISVDASAAPIIADAFRAARYIYECNEAEALENICISWLDAPCELELFAGISNRQAWEAWEARKADLDKEDDLGKAGD